MANDEALDARWLDRQHDLDTLPRHPVWAQHAWQAQHAYPGYDHKLVEVLHYSHVPGHEAPGPLYLVRTPSDDGATWTAK